MEIEGDFQRPLGSVYQLAIDVVTAPNAVEFSRRCFCLNRFSLTLSLLGGLDSIYSPLATRVRRRKEKSVVSFNGEKRKESV